VVESDTGRILQWEVPQGEWLVGVFAVTPGGICDKGEGPEVDPASRAAMQKHLDHLFGRLDPRLSRFYGSTLVDVASDSWEFVPPANAERGRFWSPAIVEAFPTLAGYDVREKLYALLGYGPEREHWMKDLEKVERELVADGYFRTIAESLHARKLRHRPQSYGRGLHRDLLEVYALADTPEIEQGLYSIPEGPWAAHTTGLPIASAESFTHLHQKMGLIRRPHGEWESNAAALRGAANYLLGEGVNRIQMHSFGYSPPGLPLPGWRMYAEVHLNRNVPWWSDLPALNAWLTRQQWLLQAGHPVADSLVYPVKSNPPDGPFDQWSASQPTSAACAVDGANFATLPRIPEAVAAGRYGVKQVVLLDALQTAEEAQQMAALLDRGTQIACVHSLPTDWPALQQSTSKETTELARRFTRAVADGQVVDAQAMGWNAAVTAGRSVNWTPTDAHLVYQHRQVRGGEIYVLVNYGDDFQGEVSFPHVGWRPERFDGDTGTITPIGHWEERGERLHIPLALPHAESVAIVFSPQERPLHVVSAAQGIFDYDDEGRLRGRFDKSAENLSITLSDRSTLPLVNALPAPIPIAGPWELSVSPRQAISQAISPTEPLSLRLEQLVPWRDIAELKYYAGRATYKTSVNVPPTWPINECRTWLELGEIFESAKVCVNGKNAGLAYCPPYRVDVSKCLAPGRNMIEIEVPNQLQNHLDQSAAYSRPSGLLGPLRLVAEHVTVLTPPVDVPPTTPQFKQVDVFRSCEEGYDTYRIPCLIESRPGRLLAICEGRKKNSSDAGDIDTVFKISDDGGATWGPLRVLWDDGENTCGNPCAVRDRQTGTLWLLHTWNRGDDREPAIIDQTSRDTRRVFVSSSRDEGLTWSMPREITADVKRDNWTWYATGPGTGIQLEHGPHAGRLVIPCDHIEAGTKRYYSHVVYSDDQGQTWKLGGTTPQDQVNECEVVERSDGSLLLNMRSYDPTRKARQSAVSRDGGLNWDEQRIVNELIDPICQATLHRLRWPDSERPGVILFANAASLKRERMTVRASLDEGRSWPMARLVHAGPAAYSSLCAFGGDEAGLLYESGEKNPYERITFARFNLAWLRGE
jgi:sialidase-1